MESSSAINPEFLERRRLGRVSLHFDVDVVLFSGNRAGDQITGKIINVSREGVGVVLRSNVEHGTQVAMTIYSNEDQTICSGVVIWRKEVKGRSIDQELPR